MQRIDRRPMDERGDAVATRAVELDSKRQTDQRGTRERPQPRHAHLSRRIAATAFVRQRVEITIGKSFQVQAGDAT